MIIRDSGVTSVHESLNFQGKSQNMMERRAVSWRICGQRHFTWPVSQWTGGPCAAPLGRWGPPPSDSGSYHHPHDPLWDLKTQYKAFTSIRLEKKPKNNMILILLSYFKSRLSWSISAALFFNKRLILSANKHSQLANVLVDTVLLSQSTDLTTVLCLCFCMQAVTMTPSLSRVDTEKWAPFKP